MKTARREEIKSALLQSTEGFFFLAWDKCGQNSLLTLCDFINKRVTALIEIYISYLIFIYFYTISFGINDLSFTK